jgi:hypothetical protein
MRRLPCAQANHRIRRRVLPRRGATRRRQWLPDCRDERAGNEPPSNHKALDHGAAAISALASAISRRSTSLRSPTNVNERS